jgi:major vault protein
MDIIHILPFNYIHVKNKTENVTRLIEGPITYIMQNDEELVKSSTPMTKLLPNTFIRIANPVLRNDKGEVQMETDFNQVKLRFGDEEIRTYLDYPNPFSLYPGETLVHEIQNARILNENQALRLYATRNFHDSISDKDRLAGDEWILRGPCLYIERVEVNVVEQIPCIIIERNTALKLKAKRNFTSVNGTKRITGQEWLVRDVGPYIPEAEEEIVEVVKATILSDLIALRIRATANFTDFYGVERKPGQEWIVTNKTASSHIPDVYETVVERLNKIVLNRWQYCIIMDPLEEGRNLFGRKVLRKGETSFFLAPGEYLKDDKIFDAQVLGEDEAVLIQAKEPYEDEYGKHAPGERWMVYGPRSYIPDIEVEVLEIRKSIPLDINEGIYVRDIHTGEIRTVSGETYLLKAHEEFWEKNVSEEVERLLQTDGSYSVNEIPALKFRNKTRVITFKVPHNSVVQVFDYKQKKNRLIFGPDLIKLGAYEQFTVLSLSGSVPKQEDQLKSLVLRLGPDYLSDAIEVETSDHARLLLRLTYSWKFGEVKTEEDCKKLFNVKDFIGDCCKSIASRVRGIVSSVSFDSFHKDSSNIVQTGVFGKDMTTGKLKKPFVFKSNNLIITNVDIQTQEPIDGKMRSILNESMRISMETTLKIQEAEAKHRENRANQEADGKIERKRITDDTIAEERRLELLKLKTENDSIISCGLAESEASAKAKQQEIKSSMELEKAKLEFEAEKKLRTVELEFRKKKMDKEISHMKQLAQLEIDKSQQSSESEINKVNTMVEAIGKDTLVELAKAGPEAQAKILKSLGIKSLLVTDGKNPVNLFNTANGLIGPMPPTGN